MKKSWMEIYGLAVCFFAVACFVIVLGMAAWDAVKMAAPGFTISSYQWEPLQTDAGYKNKLISEHRYGEEKNRYVPPEGAELTKEREDSLALAIRSESRSGFQELAHNLIVLLINLAVFVAHWKIAARARESAFGGFVAGGQ